MPEIDLEFMETAARVHRISVPEDHIAAVAIRAYLPDDAPSPLPSDAPMPAGPETFMTVLPELIYLNGVMVPYAEALSHIARIAAKYEASAIQGVCAYADDSGNLSLFRVREHLQNLRNSVGAMPIDCGYRDTDYLDAIAQSLYKNRIRHDVYIRLTVFAHDRDSRTDNRASLVCVAHARPAKPIDDKSVHAAICTWRRIDDTMMPRQIKAGANYTSRFGLLEARLNGYDDAIFLTQAGKVCKNANAFFAMARNGTLITPPVATSAPESVVRSTLLELAADLGLKVQQREIDHSELYVAEEAFFCGNGQELRPVLSVDRCRLGDGDIGPVTRRLWNLYEDTIRGRNKTRSAWLTPV